MKSRGLIGTLSVLILAQSVSSAQEIDLPDPTAEFSTSGGQRNETLSGGEIVTASSLFAGTYRLSNISRSGGGAAYSLEMAKPVLLKRLDLRIVQSKVKIHQVILVNEYGQQVEVQSLRNTEVLAAGQSKSSENLNLNAKVSKIEITAESFEAAADVLVTALAESALPQLSLAILKSTQEAFIVDTTTSSQPITAPYAPYSPGAAGSITYLPSQQTPSYMVVQIGKKYRHGNRTVTVKANYGYNLVRVSTGGFFAKEYTVNISELRPL